MRQVQPFLRSCDSRAQHFTPISTKQAQLMSEGASHFYQYGVYPTFSSEEELKVLLTLHSSQRSVHTPKGSLPQTDKREAIVLVSHEELLHSWAPSCCPTLYDSEVSRTSVTKRKVSSSILTLTDVQILTSFQIAGLRNQTNSRFF